jgi:histidine triad (HIT) family protein
MNDDCLFCRIVAGEIPATTVLETDAVLAFRDVNPQAPTHVVVIPKKHLTDVTALAAEPRLAGQLLAAVADVVAVEGLVSGFRVVFNTGEDGGQTVFHAHAHVLGGRSLGWPPG